MSVIMVVLCGTEDGHRYEHQTATFMEKEWWHMWYSTKMPHFPF